MRTKEFARKWGRSTKTVQRWDKSGKLVAKRTPSNQRYYTEDDLRVAKGLQNEQIKRKTVIYGRVSSKKQKTELENQKHALIEFCNSENLVVDDVICEVGGGLNFKRRTFLKLIFDAIDGEIETIVIAHKDRLCRFAFDLVEVIVQRGGCKFLVASQNQSSPQQELVEDLLSIIHCFSCRLYSSRSYAKQKTEIISQNLDIHEQGVLDLRRKVEC